MNVIRVACILYCKKCGSTVVDRTVPVDKNWPRDEVIRRVRALAVKRQEKGVYQGHECKNPDFEIR